MEDTWGKPTTVSHRDSVKSADTPGSMDPHMGNPAPGPGPMDPKQSMPKENPVPLTMRPTADEFRPPTPSQREIDEPPSQREPVVETTPPETVETPSDKSPLRRSTRVRKPVDIFKFDKAHGYSSI